MIKINHPRSESTDNLMLITKGAHTLGSCSRDMSQEQKLHCIRVHAGTCSGDLQWQHVAGQNHNMSQGHVAETCPLVFANMFQLQLQKLCPCDKWLNFMRHVTGKGYAEKPCCCFKSPLHVPLYVQNITVFCCSYMSLLHDPCV